MNIFFVTSAVFMIASQPLLAKASSTLEFDCYASVGASATNVEALWRVNGYYTASTPEGGIVQYRPDTTKISYLSHYGENVISPLRNFTIYDFNFSNAKNKIWLKAGNDGIGTFEVSIFVDPLDPVRNGGFVRFDFRGESDRVQEVRKGFCMVAERG